MPARDKSATENTGVKPNVTIAPETEASKFLGIWSAVKQNFWIEFKVNSTFDAGKNNRVINEARMWELDANAGTIILHGNRNVTTYNYQFSGEVLILKKEGEEEYRYVKIKKRPDK